jgi:hypothetical protein
MFARWLTILALLLFPLNAMAQGGPGSPVSWLYCEATVGPPPTWLPCSATTPLPVTGSTSAPLPVTGFDSGPKTATATPANSSHASGTSVGGLLAVPVARIAGGSGRITGFWWISTGGSTGTLAVRIWDKFPTNTTCTDNTAFVESITDDVNLIIPPFSITPAAPASTTGDTNTYAGYNSVDWDYATANTNLYVCAVATATDTADENKAVYTMLSGPQN